MKKQLSIITVNLNNASGLRKTIQSVVTQTYNDYEYIVIDGGSTDGSIAVINEFSDRITAWVSEPDRGIYNAMNKGILKAKGEYLQFLNSGDWLVNETILANVFEISRTADIIYGHLNIVSDKKSLVHKALNESRLSLIYFFNNTLPHPSSFIARKLFDGGLYDETYMISADKKFFIEKIICRNCTVQQIDEVVVNFDTSGISSRLENMIMNVKENGRIFNEIFPPRIVKDYEFYKSNYNDIRSLTNIKKNSLSYFGFKAIKKLTRLCEKWFWR
jgi:glycosyltransferase involved in cell wall biosynthesis